MSFDDSKLELRFFKNGKRVSWFQACLYTASSKGFSFSLLEPLKNISKIGGQGVNFPPLEEDSPIFTPNPRNTVDSQVCGRRGKKGGVSEVVADFIGTFLKTSFYSMKQQDYSYSGSEFDNFQDSHAHDIEAETQKLEADLDEVRERITVFTELITQSPRSIFEASVDDVSDILFLLPLSSSSSLSCLIVCYCGKYIVVRYALICGTFQINVVLAFLH